MPVPAYGDRYEIVRAATDASNLLAFRCLWSRDIFQLPGYRTRRKRLCRPGYPRTCARGERPAGGHARLVASKTATVTAKEFEEAEGRHSAVHCDLERIWEAVSIGVGIGAYDGISAEVTLAELDTFVQGFVEVDKDPRSFVMMQLMDKGEGEHLRKMQEGPEYLTIISTLHGATVTVLATMTAPNQWGRLLASEALREEEGGRSGGGLPWEETYTTGHEQSQQEAVLRQVGECAEATLRPGDTDVSALDGSVPERGHLQHDLQPYYHACAWLVTGYVPEVRQCLKGTPIPPI